jgi:ABC-type sugar transport system substrate-binding protein
MLAIAVIAKGTTHVFWKSIEAGARQAAEELGVDMSWKGPLNEDDHAQQISIVEQFASEGKNGIVLAPIDVSALRRPVQSAMEKKIPVVIIDSPLTGEAGKDFISFVGTNNKLGGEMAGETLAKLLDGKGKVVLFRYQEDCASTRQREEGFLEAIKKHPDIQLLVDNLYAGATARRSASNRDKHHRQVASSQRHFLLKRAINSGNAAGAATEQPPWEDQVRRLRHITPAWRRIEKRRDPGASGAESEKDGL